MFNIGRFFAKRYIYLIKSPVSLKLFASNAVLNRNNNVDVYQLKNENKSLLRNVKNTRALAGLVTPQAPTQQIKIITKKGFYNYVWLTEKIIALGLVIMFPVAFFSDYYETDYTLCALLPVHIHCGLSAILTDYVKGTAGKISHILNIVLSIVIFIGLVKFVTDDLRFGTAARVLWSLGDETIIAPKPESQEEEPIENSEEGSQEGSESADEKPPAPEDEPKK